MIWFLLKGLFRDRSRSLFPVLIVSCSVALIVLGHAYMEGAISDIIEVNARFEAGHVKVMTNAYYEEQFLKPNDLALTEASALLMELHESYPDYEWHPRIKFGGLLDFPDENGETLVQGTVVGIGADIMSSGSSELDNLNLKTSIVKGRLPEKTGEILLSDQFFNALGLSLGQRTTLISSSMEGGAAVANFLVVGTISFGVAGLDRGAFVADLRDIQRALYMEDATSEILGFRSGGYDTESVIAMQTDFNNRQVSENPYAPRMITIRDQSGFGDYLDLANYMVGIMVSVFVMIITLVLWNAGLRNGIRRYSEFGLRLAIGEDARHVFATLVGEAVLIGIAGSLIGTLIGLMPAWYLQEVGFNIKDMIDASVSAMLIQDVIRANITTTTLWIGMIPGVAATAAGAVMAGAGIFRRETSQLFKELEI